MRRSHPTSFILKKRDTCAVCTNIAPCPVCPKGQQCQQIFRSSCQDCPVNKCVPIPGYTDHSGANKSALGGGLAALFIVALASAFGFWFWRRLKTKRRLLALHQDAMERREKLRNEKEAMTLQLGANKSARTPNDPHSAFAIVDDDELLDNDTEYTQVSGVLNDQDRLGSLAEPTAFRRRSFGAATHLSRITEGAEEEEEEHPMPDNAASAAAAKGGNKRNTAGSIQSNARSFASGAGPRISVGSGTSSFGSHNIIPIAFKPFNAASSAASKEDDTTHDNDTAVSTLALPTTAHRPLGSPQTQLNTSPHLPIRPTRAPDLNLRLPDHQQHQPVRSSPLSNPPEASYNFMSIDPVESLKAPSSARERPVSGATIATIASTHSGSLSYVLSAPQVITPVSGEGVRRVQLGNGGKAQLVKVPSLKRKVDPFRDPEELQPPTKPFAAGEESRFSTHSTSTLGIPFGDNPFGQGVVQPLNQASPSDAEERSSWLNGELTARSDPFKDPKVEEEVRASIGGLSLLERFPFDVSQARERLPQDALRRVEEFK